MNGCVLFLAAIFAVIAFVIAIQSSNRASKALAELAELRRRLDRLSIKETEAPAEPRPEPMSPPVVITPPPEPEPVVIATPPQPEPIAAFEVEPEPMAAFEAQPIPEPEPIPPPPPPTPSPRKPFDWESLIGVKLFSWIAGIALVLAALFFLSYSVEHGWLSPPVRASLGLATRHHPAARLRAARGAQLVLAGRQQRRRGEAAD
jgi:uncharacterized membrane protein